MVTALVFLAAACGAPPRPAPPSGNDELADVLSHRGVPAGAEVWSFAPFADQGAWFGFALPGDDASGFSGPFLMASGRWLGRGLVALDTPDLSPAREASLPGLLRRSRSKGEVDWVEELWFDSASTAVVRLRLVNSGQRAALLPVAVSGSVFPDVATLEPSEGGVLARTVDGQVLRVDADAAAQVDGDNYRISLGSLEIPADSEASVSVTVSWGLDATPARPSLVVDESFRRNRERWARYLRAVPTNAEPSRRLLAAKAIQTLVNNWRAPAGRMRYSALFPSSNVNYFNGFWAWDSWKHAVALARFDTEVAKDQVRAMFDHQDEAGMIADVVYLDASEDNWRDTKPPLAGWAIQEIFDRTGDVDFVRELYPKLVAYHAFWYSSRDHDGDGLCEYGSTDGTLEAARWESGMDNAVRFDDAAMLENGPGAWSMDQESVDLNSYLYLEKRALASLASALDDPDDAARWAREADDLRARIQSEMFDDETGWFYDIDVATGEPVPVQGPEGWIPLWAGVATDEQAARVRETMLDPSKFRTHVPFPTVARDDPEFSDGYWRGLVWLDQAYFAIVGLRRYGFDDDAADLARQLVDNLEGATTLGVPLYENYDALTGEGRNVRHFSWSAAHLLLLAHEG